MSSRKFGARPEFFVLPVLAILFSPIISSAQADGLQQNEATQSKATCAVVNYEVLTPYAVALKCSEPVTGDLQGFGKLFLNSVTDGKQITDEVLLSSSKASRYWILLTWPAATSASLLPGKTYVFKVPIEVPPSAPVTPADGMPQPDLYTTSISTKYSVSIVAKLLASEPARFEMTSHVAFSSDGSKLAVSKRDAVKVGDRKLQPCRIPIVTLTPKKTYIEAKCSELDTVSNSDLPTLVNLDISLVGIYDVEISPILSTAVIPLSLPIRDVFGNTPIFDPKSRFARQNACATIQPCSLNLSVNYAAGVGVLPAWVLNGKYSPIVTSVSQFFVAPVLAADIGNNTLKGQTYTNTVDIGGTAQRVFLPSQTLQDLVLTFGPTYETDRQFDRHNLMATGDLQFYFARLYRTQQQRALEDYNKAAKIPSLQLSDMPLRTIGYQLDFHAGIETGGALVASTVDASKGSATAVLPQYPIFRLVPQVHFLLQVWRFSFDESFVGRYLATTENTIVQTPANSLFLKTEHGWKGISTLTGGFALDPQGNFNLTVTFKDGFAPPNYQRVNAVQAGILIKY